MKLLNTLINFVKNFFHKSDLIKLAEIIENIYGKDQSGTRLIVVNGITIGKTKLSYEVLRQIKYKLVANDLATKLSQKLKFPKKYISVKENKTKTYTVSFDNRVKKLFT